MLLPFLTTLASYLTKSPPLHPSVDPNFVLTGNFAPVDETPPTECLVVEGELPRSLHGVYIRNGPNPQHQPLGPHHLFEGDGMLHSILLSQGRAIFCSRYVKTYKYKLEHDAGFPMIPNFLSGFYGIGDVGHGIVALARAMTGQIRRHDFDGKAPVNMTAHPKMDEETGEVFAFRCFPVVPYLTYFRFDSNGCKEKDVPIFSINTQLMSMILGSLSISNISDIVLEMAPMDMIMLQGMPVRCRPNKVPRVGIIEGMRHPIRNEMVRSAWFNALHIIKAWEDDQSGIIIVAPNALNIENFFHNRDNVHFSLEKLRINMKTSEITRSVLSKRSLELGSINPSYAGKKSR
ncbi:hypothetical protein C3L33_09038, partial [Rhododendron williamsianum]